MLPKFPKTALRDIFPITKTYNYLNHAAVLPNPFQQIVGNVSRNIAERAC